MSVAVPDNVLFLRTPAKMTRDDIRSFVAEVEAKLAVHDKVGMVSDVTQLEGMTIGAVFEDMKSEIQYLGQWHRFPKVALIAEEGFVKSFAGTVSAILPSSVEMKVFAPGQEDEAIAFAATA